jgi:hypothetical protein
LAEFLDSLIGRFALRWAASSPRQVAVRVIRRNSDPGPTAYCFFAGSRSSISSILSGIFVSSWRYNSRNLLRSVHADQIDSFVDLRREPLVIDCVRGENAA